MAKKAHIYIYGAIAQADPFAEMFGGESQTVSAKDISEQLANIKQKEIDVHIKSNGGSVSEGYAIHDLLVNSGKKINTIGEGEVRSIATVVFLAGSERLISENCDFTIHNPWLDPTNMGKMEGDDLIKTGNEMKQEEKKLAEFYSRKTGHPVDQIKNKMEVETTLSAQECIDLGFATKILEPVKAFAYYPKTKTNKINNNIMNTKLGTLAKQILNIINGTVKADASPLADGSSIYHDGELAEGSACFSDEEMTVPCADGDYEFEDGTIATISGGVVTALVIPMTDEEASAKKAIEDKANAEKEEAKKLADAKKTEDEVKAEKKVADLEKVIADKDAELNALKKEQDAQAKNMLNIMNEVKTLKKVIPGGSEPVKIGNQYFVKDKSGSLIPQADTSKMSDYTKRVLNASK